MSRATAERGTLRLSPADAMVAAAAFVASFFLPPAGRAGAAAGFDPGELAARGWPSTALIVAAALLLLWRRRAPIPVWAAVLAICVVDTALTGLPSRAMVPLMVALYSVAVRTNRRTAAAAAVSTALVLVLATVWSGEPSFGTDAMYALAAFCGLAAALGDAVRSQSEAVAAANGRAAAAEASREDEARRRVAEERLRIARELHDAVAHHVSVINVQAGVAAHLLESNPAAARQALRHVRSAGGQVIEEMRSMVGLLRTDEGSDAVEPPMPGLAQVPALVEGMRATGLRVAFDAPTTDAPVPPTIGLTAYRVIQEALTNAAKHGTGSASLEIRRTGSALQIDVANPAAATGADRHRPGHGLTGMQERVAAAGGTLAVTPGPTFRVQVALPQEVPS